MRKIVFVLVMVLGACVVLCGQNLTVTSISRLQIMGTLNDTSYVPVYSESLKISYERNKMIGEISTADLRSENEMVTEMLEYLKIETIRFESMVPSEKFIYSEQKKEIFTAEADLYTAKIQSKFIMDFNVTNLKVAEKSRFQINCTGKLSLTNNFGMTDLFGFTDEISFQFIHNVTAIH